MLGFWVKKMTRLSKDKIIDTNNFMVITRGKEDWRDVEVGKGGINGDERRLDIGC